MKKKNVYPFGLCLNDTHIEDDNIPVVKDIFRQAIEVCKTRNISRIFFGGDWFYSRKAQSLAVLMATLDIKQMLYDAGIEVDAIHGNHDTVNQESEISYLTMFSDMDFRVHGYGCSFDFGDTVLHMLPYFPENGSYCERLLKHTQNHLVPGKFNIMYTHIGVNGGLAHESASSNKEVPATIFADYDLVGVSHYHNQCQVGDYPIFYFGSSHQRNHGEDNQKGFTLLYTDGTKEFIKSKFQEYRTITVDAEEVNPKFLKNLKKDIQTTGDKVRVILTGDESKLKAVDKRALEEAGVSKIKLLDERLAIDGTKAQESFKSFNKADILKEYYTFSVSNELAPELGLGYLETIKG